MSRPPPPRPSLIDRFVAPVDIAPLVWFRVAFGLILFVEVTRFFRNGWIARYYTAPKFLFKYYGFDWVRPWPGEGMNLHFFLLAILALCICFGLFYRLAAALFFLGFTYVFLLEQARYLNHFYLVCLFSFVLAVIPAHHAFSFDAWRRPKLQRAFAPAWSLWLLRCQMAVVYFFGGVAKLNSDWLHGEPLRMWLARRADYPVIGPYLTHEPVVYFFSYGGLLFDLGIVPLLMWRRTRLVAFIAAALFNLTNAWIFQIGIFPWLALGATVILFTDRLPHFWKQNGPAPAAPPLPWRGAIAASVCGYVALQCAVPLRHWFYPGDVQWTEEGHRFSWRMKLRSKDARLSLFARDPDSGQVWRVSLSPYVNAMQRDEAAGRPDMILQLAHRVAADLRQQGHRHVEVRARARVSLNGRTEQLLIDPEIDLAAQPRTLGHATWITTLNVPLSERAKSSPGNNEEPARPADGG